MRRLLLAIGLLLLAVLSVLGLGLGCAHLSIRSIDPPLPEVDDLLRAPEVGELPVRLRWINTASQPMPRSAVLDAALDPTPDERYVMSHSSFALEWADGRIFLIDAGMDRESALAFGGPLELLSGADPIEPRASTVEQLGADVSRVQGVAFTHLHTDHTGGIGGLCAAAPGRIRLVQGRPQAERTNYTTRAGAAQLAAAPCLDRETLDGTPPLGVPGFPGLALIPVAGHTPCSQLLVAHVREGDSVRTWVFTGDLVNALDGVRRDLPKPWLYSLLVVPEATGRLSWLRGLLRELSQRPGIGLLVSHDQLSLAASGL